MQLDQAFLEKVEPAFTEVWERCDQTIVLGDDDPNLYTEAERAEMNGDAIDFCYESAMMEYSFENVKQLIHQAADEHGWKTVDNFLYENIMLL